MHEMTDSERAPSTAQNAANVQYATVRFKMKVTRCWIIQPVELFHFWTGWRFSNHRLIRWGRIRSSLHSTSKDNEIFDQLTAPLSLQFNWTAANEAPKIDKFHRSTHFIQLQTPFFGELIWMTQLVLMLIFNGDLNAITASLNVVCTTPAIARSIKRLVFRLNGNSN